MNENPTTDDLIGPDTLADGNASFPIDPERLEILHEIEDPLEQVFPEEFERYNNLFIRYMKHTPCHIKETYDTGFIAKKGTRKDGTSYYKPCYPALVAKMLDPDRWKLQQDRPPRYPSCWIGLNAGVRSSLKAIDFDNKDNCLGFYDRQEGEGFVRRPIPILTVDHLKNMKRIYDAFPGHIWCVSSATLGLHIWQKLPGPQPLWIIENLNRPRLERIGLPKTEIHPMQGRVFRRPFGQDYFTIADNGLISDWRQQLHFFEKVATIPSFESIYRNLRKLVVSEWATFKLSTHEPWIKIDEITKHKPHLLQFIKGRWINNAALDKALKELDDWAESGFPNTPIVSVNIPAEPPKTSIISATTNTNIIKNSNTSITNTSPKLTAPNKFTGLSEICKSGWVQRCEEWADQGLPEPDSIFLVVSQLARYLYFVELWHLPESERQDKTIKLLVTYCLNKNNGYITRLQQDLVEEVCQHVRRIVQTSIEAVNEQGRKWFEIIRQKQDSGAYKRVIKLEPLSLSAVTRPQESGVPPLLVGFTSCCTLSRRPSTRPDRQKKAGEWIFQPDDTPLPENLMKVLTKFYGTRQFQLRASSLRTITRFINHLKAVGGMGHLSIKALKKIGFSNNRVRRHLLRLEAAGLIWKGGYAPYAGIGRQFGLTDDVKKEFI